MSDFDVTRVLSQIRALQAQTATLSKPAAAPQAGAPGFGTIMAAAMDRVSLSQATAASMQTKFETGDTGTDLSSVMVATSRAQVEFRGLVEVRNRMVRAYQDIMNMPL